jgi:CBS domain-containing protein
MYVREYMMPNPVTITSRATLAAAQELMKAGKFRRLPVVDDGVLVGILSEYDLRDRLDRLERVPVSAAMTHEVVTVAPVDTLEHAVNITRKHEISALPVVDHGHLVGIITVKDLWIAEPRPLPQWDR